MKNIRTEIWHGKEIRFVEIEGEWWAILKDICDALKLRTAKVSERLDPDMMMRVCVEVSNVPSKDLRSNDPSMMVRSRGQNKTRQMIAVNEIGIYEALYASKKLEARKFRRWSAEVMKKLRRSVGLEGYQVMQMTEKEVQDDIDHILDTLFYDEKTGVLMRSITIAGGDVDQIPFEID